ncbi:MAG: LptF/LptG family permease, partial [Gammaproteobacteria bacterium]|nr:LptF/LptG family permease [Gammaproteobacteria bacterium]MBT7327237.1 LptF/LptG family permease [Gammaproteobacteria bacterium]
MRSEVMGINKRKTTFTILEKYLLRQVAGIWAVASPLLIILLLTLEVSKLMAKAAAGIIPVEYVWQLLWLRVPTHLGMVVPMTLFFAVLLAFGRLYQSSEVTAFRASGIDIFEASRG